MQTATDYIFEKLEENSLFFRGTDNELNISISASDYLDLKRLSKEMHKQQIVDAVNKFALGSDEVVRIILKKYNLLNTGEEYYNETYGSKGSDEIKTN